MAAEKLWGKQDPKDMSIEELDESTRTRVIDPKEGLEGTEEKIARQAAEVQALINKLSS